MYTYTSIYRPEGKPPIVHTWGLFATRRDATNAKNRSKTAQRQREREDHRYDVDYVGSQKAGLLTYHVGAVLDDKNGSILSAKAMADVIIASGEDLA